VRSFIGRYDSIITYSSGCDGSVFGLEGLGAGLRLTALKTATIVPPLRWYDLATGKPLRRACGPSTTRWMKLMNVLTWEESIGRCEMTRAVLLCECGRAHVILSLTRAMLKSW
jgi:hypothetical protein